MAKKNQIGRPFEPPRELTHYEFKEKYSQLTIEKARLELSNELHDLERKCDRLKGNDPLYNAYSSRIKILKGFIFMMDNKTRPASTYDDEYMFELFIEVINAIYENSGKDHPIISE